VQEPPVKLDYESPPTGPGLPMVGLMWLINGTIVAAVVHLVGCGVRGHKLFALAGGFSTSGRWTTYGGIGFAPTPLAWIPGGLILVLTDNRNMPNPLGWLVLLGGSLFAGYLLAAVLLAPFRLGPGCGRYRWRLWCCMLLWLVWIPVPVRMTLTYWFTVAY